jgi:aconitase A
MALNLTQTLISSHLVTGNMKPGNEIALRIDQALLQDVLGTLVMLELEAMGVDRVRIDRAAQYIDHNLLETDNLNSDEHLFLRSACRRFGIWYRRSGNGISHPVHMQRFGKPGDTLIGSDSHTAAAGSMGMFAFGAGGIGANYGQGSSRENAAIAPRYLGARVVIAKSFARIHWQNLINFGVLPLTFTDASDYDRLKAGDTIRIASAEAALTAGHRDHGDHRRIRQFNYAASQHISTTNQDPHGWRSH